MTSNSICSALDCVLGAEVDQLAAGNALQQLGALSAQALPEILSEMLKRPARLAESDPAIVSGLLLAIQQIAGRLHNDASLSRDEMMMSEPLDVLNELVPAAIPELLKSLPGQTLHRHRLLYLLAVLRTDAALAVLVEQLIVAPPNQWEEVGQVLSPLMQSSDWDVEALFPRVLEALQHRSVATPLLDLANFVARSRQTAAHPCENKSELLAFLLGEVVGRLGKLEENPLAFGGSVEEVQKTLDEAVCLAVSLCDALGLIGSEKATGKLFQAMQVKHRRVQTEAAGALARLGIGEGKTHLLALAAEPVARLRVLAYAEELGCSDEVDEEFLSDYARAEAELALWLAAPTQLGVPPTDLEVINTELLYWPSYAQPVDCFLIRFAYDMGDRVFANIGITGPLVHAIEADLTDLEIGDVYAVYAGWHVDHPQILSISSTTWNQAQKRLANTLTGALEREGYDGIAPELLGFCFDENALVASALHGEEEVWVVTDGLETLMRAKKNGGRLWNAQTMWQWYLGRKMLRTFNPESRLEI